MEAADVRNEWVSSSWGRKLIVQKRKASLNDFDSLKRRRRHQARAGQALKGGCGLSFLINESFKMQVDASEIHE
ncbi:hypothetical protein MUK42_08482, partial [Musa troglodytarum]